MAIRIVKVQDALKEANVRDHIETYSRKSDSFFSMYGSLSYLDSVSKFNDKLYFIIRDHEGAVTHSMVLQEKKHTLTLLPLKRFKWNIPLKAADLLTCDVFGDDVSEHLTEMINAVFEHLDVKCITLKSVREDCRLSGALMHSMFQKQSGHLTLDEHGTRDFYTIRLDGTFDTYLNKFKKKERYNLKRQCRLAAEASQDGLNLVRITTTEQVNEFIGHAKVILANSWKSEEDEFNFVFSERQCELYIELAKVGLLRSYLLIVRDQPCAYILAYQWNGVYHYANIAYDQKYSDLSPGTVLFYHMLEDLYSYNKPDVVNFGIWGAFYKKRFSNYKCNDRSILIMNRNTKNILVVLSIQLRNQIKKIIKSAESW